MPNPGPVGQILSAIPLYGRNLPRIHSEGQGGGFDVPLEDVKDIQKAFEPLQKLQWFRWIKLGGHLALVFEVSLQSVKSFTCMRMANNTMAKIARQLPVLEELFAANNRNQQPNSRVTASINDPEHFQHLRRLRITIVSTYLLNLAACMNLKSLEVVNLVVLEPQQALASLRSRVASFEGSACLRVFNLKLLTTS